jgi:hypothetical protein
LPWGLLVPCLGADARERFALLDALVQVRPEPKAAPGLDER